TSTSARPGRTWTSSGTAPARPRWTSGRRTSEFGRAATMRSPVCGRFTGDLTVAARPARISLRGPALDPGRLPLVVQLQPVAVVGFSLRVAHQFDRLLLPLDRVGELPALGGRRGERVEVARLGPLGQ